ncbi:camphor resistance protein CrcB [Hafnia alvei]|uniref:Fluoride-specific ion channel n=1 Tax=Hafnia alvei TaxID=569 RepID=A0A377PEK8_HAFAL|nr:camphor resistance protein CrcB [Hafnia alvei]
MSYGLTLLIVAFGGAVGAITRFQITNWFNGWFGNSFPYATLTVNVVGCFIMGLLVAALNTGTLISPHWRPLIAVGFLGR